MPIVRAMLGSRCLRLAVVVALLASLAHAHNPGEPFAHPGTQPATFQEGLAPPGDCDDCHGQVDRSDQGAIAPFDAWRGSMMANAARDPLFLAALTVANQDVPNSGSFCLRCHAPVGWLNGRSLPGSGSALTPDDQEGVTCAFCHRLKPGREEQPPGPLIGNGSAWLDDSATYTGVRLDGGAPHPVKADPYLRSAELCGVCHSVSNPALPMRAADGTEIAPRLPEQRTYEEWAASAFAAEDRTCVDCHMPRRPGRAALDDQAPVRPDLAVHTFAGGNALGPLLMDAAYPGEAPEAYAAAHAASREMLGQAAAVRVRFVGAPIEGGARVVVEVENRTGHKLPTGYPDGRRMWLEATAKVDDAAPHWQSPAHDAVTDTLPPDVLRTWQARLGAVGRGHHFHLLQYDTVLEDTRIPPRGLRATPELAPRGRDYGPQPDGTLRHWDTFEFEVPVPQDAGARLQVEVNLRWQSLTRDYVDFLVAENRTDDRGVRLAAAVDAAGGLAPLELTRARATLRLDAAVVAEVCDGVDDDLDGRVDEGSPAVECGVGECRVESPTCDAGQAIVCVAGRPERELCNALDDDCDGQTDEALPGRVCGFGVCRREAAACVDGEVPPCEPGIGSPELCNGIDDDCDGPADEDLGVESCGVGACARTQPLCRQGRLRVCEPGRPGVETCDGLDNDCDGATDEAGASGSCGVGQCARQVEGCVNGAPAPCVPGEPSAETCDGADNDCDDRVDEDFVGRRASCGLGACTRTVEVCQAGRPVDCEPGAPTPETCDGTDEDCDGRVDDAPRPELCGLGNCTAESAFCRDGRAEGCWPGEPAEELCNLEDDDCDGATDEDFVGLVSTCGVGACQSSVPRCLDGERVRCLPGAPSLEVCDGVDDDCDGATDEQCAAPDATPSGEPDLGPLDGGALAGDVPAPLPDAGGSSPDARSPDTGVDAASAVDAALATDVGNPRADLSANDAAPSADAAPTPRDGVAVESGLEDGARPSPEADVPFVLDAGDVGSPSRATDAGAAGCASTRAYPDADPRFWVFVWLSLFWVHRRGRRGKRPGAHAGDEP